jgi:hypothetical protein
MRNGLLTICLLVLPCSAVSARDVHDLDIVGLSPEASGRAIFEAADRRASGYADMQVELEMILRGSRGAENRRLLRLKQFEVPEDGDKLLLVFDTPKPIKGTALLSFSHKHDPDDQWLYLPAMKRVKKITSRNKSGPFLSSEFAYEDLTAQELDKFNYRLLRVEPLSEMACYVVERIPLDGYSGYARQLVWLDKAELRIQQIEYYDRRDDFLQLELTRYS